VKTWVKVLLIGIAIMISGLFIPVNGTYGFGGMYVVGLGLIFVIGALVAAARRLMGKMVND
jgi:hypothetical protein